LDKSSWDRFNKARDKFYKLTNELNKTFPELQGIQQKFVDSRGGNAVYKVETPVVYNTALDDITINSEIKLILVADNPGRREQSAENKKYLVGPSGKIAAKFFRDNLNMDFYKNVIILNKTPVHSPRTIELKDLCKLGGQAVASALEKSQKDMAHLLLEFHTALSVPVYITGYSEMKKGGLFEIYTKELKRLYADKPAMYKQLFFFRHFSMNQFTIDLKKQALPGESVAKSLNRIGTGYRQRILNNV
jgi:hypothetical protein